MSTLLFKVSFENIETGATGFLFTNGIDKFLSSKYCNTKIKDVKSDKEFTIKSSILEQLEKPKKQKKIFDIKKEAKKQIHRCKDSCYGKELFHSDFPEGDYGNWKDWEKLLVRFAERAVKNCR